MKKVKNLLVALAIMGFFAQGSTVSASCEISYEKGEYTVKTANGDTTLTTKNTAIMAIFVQMNCPPPK